MGGARALSDSAASVLSDRGFTPPCARGSGAGFLRRGDRQKLLQQALADAARIEKENMQWSRGLALLIRAGVEKQRGNLSRADIATDAGQALETAQVRVYAAAAQYRRGELLPAMPRRWSGRVNPSRRSESSNVDKLLRLLAARPLYDPSFGHREIKPRTGGVSDRTPQPFQLVAGWYHRAIAFGTGSFSDFSLRCPASGWRAFVLLLIVLSCAPAVWAQSNAAAGELQGSVLDPSGATRSRQPCDGSESHHRPDTVHVQRCVRQLPRPLTSSRRVRTASREIRIQRQVVRGIRVTVGQTAQFDIHLQLETTKEVVEVSGEVALLETARTQQANVMQEEWIRNLPIDRRDYLTYTLLTPAAVDSNALADNADFRPKQTPSSGLSFFGSNGRGNFFSIDGGEANDSTGGVRTTVSQEAVQEFQVNRSNYAAELGGANGAVINIVTKTGSNDFHGGVFGYFRDDVFDAGNPFARVLQGDTIVRIKPPSHRQQFGDVCRRSSEAGPDFLLRRRRRSHPQRIVGRQSSNRSFHLRAHSRSGGVPRATAFQRRGPTTPVADEPAEHGSDVRKELGCVPVP